MLENFTPAGKSHGWEIVPLLRRLVPAGIIINHLRGRPRNRLFPTLVALLARKCACGGWYNGDHGLAFEPRFRKKGTGWVPQREEGWEDGVREGHPGLKDTHAQKNESGESEAPCINLPYNRAGRFKSKLFWGYFQAQHFLARCPTYSARRNFHGSSYPAITTEISGN